MSKPVTPPAAHATVAVPRLWLVLIPAACVLPWLVVAGLYLRGSSASPVTADAPAPAATAGAQNAKPLAAGPWGELMTYSVVVSPPLELVKHDWAERAPDVWLFPGVPAEQVPAGLRSLGLSAEQVGRVEVAPEPRINGAAVRPDPQLVRTLSREQRAGVYALLGKSELNLDQANPLRFEGASAEEWFHGSLISEATRKTVEPLVYRLGGFLYFADFKTVAAQIEDPLERQRLGKVLLRQKSLLVTLTVKDSASVPALADYWGRGGRRIDVRPLLESVGSGGGPHTIDIVHLLPSFARERLYRYPRVAPADYQKPLLANCLWTVLNFFAAAPDDRYLDVPQALKTLATEYSIVHSDYQLGDVVALLDPQGNLFHAAVYLADNLVFTKNGTSPVAPWTIMSLDRLTDYYRLQTETPRLLYHRRNGL